MKKKLLSIVILVLMICLNVFITVEAYVSSASKDVSVESFETLFFENQSRSIAVYDDVISRYRSISMRGTDEIVTYSDDFAGVFIDEKGILNIALLQTSDFDPTFDGQILYRQHQFSYNYLQEIKEAVVNVMEDFDIHMVGIDEKSNQVTVYISKEQNIEKISNFIMDQTHFDNSAIKYIVESAAVKHNLSYGGESITAAGYRGTICVPAIDNVTGQLGILTNEHVVPTGTTANYRGHWNGSTFTTNVHLGTALKGQHSGTIDASFVPYTNQGSWEISPYGRYGSTTSTNIRLGNNNQIVQGRSVRKIGQTSGITNGIITATNISVYLNYGTIENPNIQEITNVFRYSNESLGGDSGGPVYFNDGEDMHLIGINFAGPADPGNATYGIACRIQNVMNILNVTPITNDSFDTSNLTNIDVRLNRINFNPTGEFILPNQLNGRTVTQIRSSAFSNQTQLTKITIPSTVTHVGNDAFKKTNDAAIYLEGKASVPNTFNAKWNVSNNPVYLNGVKCLHDGTKTRVSLDTTHHADLCDKCRTATNITKHSFYTLNCTEQCSGCSYQGLADHDYVYTPKGTTNPYEMKQHYADCMTCGDRSILPCLGIVQSPDEDVYCLLCGRLMTTPLPMYMIKMPNGDILVSSEKIEYEYFLSISKKFDYNEVSYSYFEKNNKLMINYDKNLNLEELYLIPKMYELEEFIND